MTASTDKDNTRRRAPHTRSKLGCKTCRIRRVKCDQTRPKCRKCTLTGRHCDGYPLGQMGLALNYIAKCPSTSSNTAFENRSLQYFQQFTAYQFAGCFEADFWCTLVLQASCQQPCVQNAVIALGSLHEAFQNSRSYSSRNQSPPFDLKRNACDHYSKAIALLNSHISAQGWDGICVSLLCCILCVGFEWLRGCYADAQVHLSNGLRVLREWDREQNQFTTISASTRDLIRNTIAPIYTRLALQTRTFMSDRLQWESYTPTMSPTANNGSLKLARDRLDALLAEIYLSEPMEEGASIFDSSARLSAWFNSYTSDISAADITPDKVPQALILNITHTVARTMLETSESDDQMQFDRYNPTFKDIVDRAELFISSCGPSFSVDIAIVPVLYFVAIKCRDPVTRRKAISLLQDTARREGLWDGLACASIAREMVSIEECGLTGEYHSDDVVEYSRIKERDFTMDLERRSIAIRFMYQHETSWSQERFIVW